VIRSLPRTPPQDRPVKVSSSGETLSAVAGTDIEQNTPVEGVDVELLEAGRVGKASRLDKLGRETRTFLRFVKLLLPYKDKAILIMLLILVAVPLGEIGLFLFRVLVDEVVLNFDRPIGERLTLFYLILGTQLIFWILHHGMGVLRQIFGFYLDMKISIKLRHTFYNHLHTLSLGFLRSRPVGEHMYRTTADTTGGGRQGVVYMITDDIPQAFSLVYRIVWAGGLLIAVDWKLAMVVVVYMIPYTGFSHYLYTLLKGTMRQLKIQQQRCAALLRDGIRGVKTVKGFGRVNYQVLKYTQQVYEERRVWWKWAMLSMLTHSIVLWTIHQLVTQGMWIYAAYRVMTGHLSVGEYMIVFALVRRLERPLEQFVKLMQSIRMQLVPAERILETLDVTPEIVDAPDAEPIATIQGRVEFRDVHFSYDPEKPVLRGLNVTVEPGESVAFVGPSGAGKSTVMYLLMRLYDVDSGQVLIDDTPIQTVTMDSFLDQMGVVLQETHLFGGTFTDNIRYGKLQADDEEVAQAARMAEIHEFIESLPDGYERDLGEGLKLSGGQQQRLGIARALIRDPRILLLDEATASLDSRIECQIVRTIEKIMRGRTTLMISHRLVTVTGCDRIVVIDEGRVAEQGTHRELLANDGLYKLMWDEQTRGAAD
jgi:ATP-binding cassette, subfamily B, bacterial MsbA